MDQQQQQIDAHLIRVSQELINIDDLLNEHNDKNIQSE